MLHKDLLLDIRMIFKLIYMHMQFFFADLIAIERTEFVVRTN